MIAVRIIAVGTLKEAPWKEAFFTYAKRMAPYVKLSVEEIAASPFRTDAEKEKAKKEESARVRRAIGNAGKENVFLLDEKGKGYASEAFAKLLDERQPITFVLGGALGFDETLKKELPAIALSALTFPHELARVVLAEQIYRAAAILRGKKYHY